MTLSKRSKRRGEQLAKRKELQKENNKRRVTGFSRPKISNNRKD